MKRDLDVMRLLALQIETGHPPPGIEKYSDAERGYNSCLLIEGKLAIGRAEFDRRSADLRDLTWAGHDFVDASRDPGVWKRTKAKLDKAGAFTFEAMIKLLKSEVSAQLGEPASPPPAVRSARGKSGRGETSRP